MLKIAKQLDMNPSTIREYLLKAGTHLRDFDDYDKPQCRKRSFHTCENCGKRFHHPQRRRFCSPACKIAWYRGANTYNYLGEEAREFPRDLIWLTFWIERAALIRERDKVCRHCGKTVAQNGRALDVHHIIPYRLSKDNSPENLIALCRSCHRRAEHEYCQGEQYSRIS